MLKIRGDRLCDHEHWVLRGSCWKSLVSSPPSLILWVDILHMLRLTTCPWDAPKQIPVTRPRTGVNLYCVEWPNLCWWHLSLRGGDTWRFSCTLKSLSQKSTPKQEIKFTEPKTKPWDSTDTHWRNQLTVRKREVTLEQSNHSKVRSEISEKLDVSILISGDIVTGFSFKKNLFSMGWRLH